MNDRDAQEIIRMVEGTWSVNYGQHGRRLWAEMLVKYDAEIATKATALLSERQRERPTPADLRNMILKLQRDLVAARPQLAGPRHEIPEWVQVWNYARRIRKPRNLIPFPQQKGHVDDALCMSMEEYEKLRGEWEKAGKPRLSVDELLRTPKRDYAGEVLAVLKEVAE